MLFISKYLAKIIQIILHVIQFLFIYLLNNYPVVN